MNPKQIHLIFFLVGFSLSCFSQTSDSVKIIHHFSGSANVTNNGISLVPSFSLGRPAALFLLSLGGERFSFDPDIRFSLDGKPWTFLFWTRYKLFTEGRFRMNTGAHLGLNFRTTTLPDNGAGIEFLVVRRYLAGELTPTYSIAKNISIGSYYLYSRGVDNGAVRNTHFLTLNTNFSRIPVSKLFYLRAVPQVYYLFQDGNKGYFFTSTFTVVKQNFPWSISTIINKQLRSGIPGAKDFVWNVSLVYSFSRNYVPKPPAL